MLNLPFPKLLKNDIAIDLGTANTLIYIKDEGIVVNEPSVVAVRKATQEILAFGNQAKEMLGRTPGEIVTVRPLKDGVIADFELAEQMIRHFIRKARRGWAFRPRIAISIPSGITEVEKRAVRDSAEHVGAREVHLVSEPMAAAIGVGLPIDLPVGSMVIDIGGGTTEIAVISLSGIVKAISLRVAGDEETESIIRYCRKKFNILIGENTAEEIKCTIGSAAPYRWHGPKQVEGLDVQTGETKSIELSAEKVIMQLPAVEHEPEFNLVISRIQQYVQQKFGAQIDSRLASRLANSLGYGLVPDEIQTMSIRGRDLVTGIPRTITVSSMEIQEALSDAVNAIVKAVLKCLEETPPELAADILERGIILSGGGGLLKNLDQRLRKETELPVYLVDDALLCVVKGVGRVLENLTGFHKVLLQNKRQYF